MLKIKLYLTFVCLSVCLSVILYKSGLHKEEEFNRSVKIYSTLALRTLLKSREGHDCSTLGEGTPVPGLPNEGGGSPAAAVTVGRIAPVLWQPPPDVTLPVPVPSSGESKTVSRARC
jgi:hypothetical protein